MGLAHDINNLARTDDVRIEQSVTFDNMLLSTDTLKGLHRAGFNKPSPIQLHGVPLGKCGFDLLLEAKSGTGKTLVFSVISLEKICFDEGLQVIILAPTREIAAQVHNVITVIGSTYTDLVVEVVMGGLPFHDDVLKFKKNNVHIVVGSPGRLRHLIQDQHINLTNVRLVVLDEADKLMEDSFQADVNYIFSSLPKQKQVIMSSATYPDSTKLFIDNYMRNAQHVRPDSSNVLIGISQKVTLVKYNSNIVIQTLNKYQNLLKIFTEKQFKQCLVFCNYQARVNEVCKLLRRDKWPVEKLFGQQDQYNRLNTLKTLTEFKCRILVCTDLAARGIDASNVDLVINFEPPYDWVTYLHRIGRAGRYGSYGTAVTILSEGKEDENFKSMLAIVKENLNVSDFFASENEDCSFISENTLKASDILNFRDNARDSNKALSADYLTKVWNINTSKGTIGQLESFHSLNTSFQNSDKIETFFDLINCYENVGVKNCSNNNYKTINVKEYVQNTPITQDFPTECNTLLNDVNKENLHCNRQINNKSHIDSRISANNDSIDKLLSEKSYHNLLNKENLSNNTSEIINFHAYGDSKGNELIQYNLPTCFSSTKHKKMKINNPIKKNKEYKIKEKMSHVSPLIDETISTTSSDSNDDFYVMRYQDISRRQKHLHQSKNPDITGSYKSDWNQNKQIDFYHSNYLHWYKELKFRIKHIEYAFYIEEMNK